MEKIIHSWIYSLINQTPNINLIDSDSFHLEDGMNLAEYINYELSQFKNLSHIFDLNINFSIRIIHSTILKENISTYYFLIINEKNNIVCKMHITINNDTLKITSNNHLEQTVPKFGLLNGEPNEIGFAIKTPLNLIKVFSPDLELIDFFPGDNFKHDHFYSLKFHFENKFNSEIRLNFVYNNNGKIVTKKRTVFLDEIYPELKPFNIQNNTLSIINEMYPVGASFHYKDRNIKTIEYPRNLSVNLEDITKLTITDSMDNDWHVSF